MTLFSENKFNYTKKNEPTRERNVYVLCETDKYIEGFDVEHLTENERKFCLDNAQAIEQIITDKEHVVESEINLKLNSIMKNGCFRRFNKVNIS